MKKLYNWSLVTFNIPNFEFPKYWSFYIWSFKILTPTPLVNHGFLIRKTFDT